MAETSEVSEETLIACRRLIGGDWYSPSLPLHLLPAVHIEPISQGHTTKLYILSLKPNTASNSQSLSASPLSVLLRLFGDSWTQEEILTQNIVYSILSERGLAPKLYGVLSHPQGRLEHFYACRTLRSAELNQPEVLSLTTRLLANMHMQCMPVNKEPSLVFRCMRRWLKQSRDIYLSDAWRQGMLNGMLSERKWEEEIDWLEEHLKLLNYPIVFCHNDLYSQNIIRLNTEKLEIRFIDFELSSYNYRGFDFAQLFQDFVFDYSYTEHPGYKYLPDQYPSDDKLRNIVRFYLECLDGKVKKEAVDRLVIEIKQTKLYSCMFVFMWGLRSSRLDLYPFDPLYFSKTYLSMYSTEKEKLKSQESQTK